MRTIITTLLVALALLTSILPVSAQQGGGLGAWQNPDIGFVYDLKFDMHNAEMDSDGGQTWTTRGFQLSTAELSIGADLDPYARIDFNAMFFSDGAEVHELYVTGHSLPLSLKARAGQFLASFGRWSQFHSHSMPFASEPRIMHEYLGGHLMPTGLELSWLAPTDHYIEAFGGIFNGITGHTHDVDPMNSQADYGPDNPPPGCHFHGDEIHCPDNPYLEDLYRSMVVDPDGPVAPGVNKKLSDLAWLGRLQTSWELGLNWSIDLGSSLVYQKAFRQSQRFAGTDYAKTTGGVDLTVFWNPVEQNLYRGLDFGIEYLRNRQQDESRAGENWVKRTTVRDGAFTWARFRLNRTWDFGTYYEDFAPVVDNGRRTRLGGFLTWNVSHYQKIRLEYVRDDRGLNADSVDQVILQFDGVIGFHTHGRQR